MKKLTLEKISQIDEKLKQLQNLNELSYLAENCGDDRPIVQFLMLCQKMKNLSDTTVSIILMIISGFSL